MTDVTSEESFSELELELRLLPGVVDVGFAPLEPNGHVAISVVALDAEPDLDRAATRVARAYGGSASIELIDLTSSPRPFAGSAVATDERVALIDSVVDPSGEAEVVLGWMGRSAHATAAGGTLIGPAKATLAALDGLGLAVAATLASVSTGQGVDNPPVRVILRSDHDETEFVGIARGRAEPESAARATLAAYNRYAGSHQAQLP